MAEGLLAGRQWPVEGRPPISLWDDAPDSVAMPTHIADTATAIPTIPGYENLTATLNEPEMFRAYTIGALAFQRQAARLEDRPRRVKSVWHSPALPPSNTGRLTLVETDDMPHIAHGIASFISEERPDLVIAADRGGRFVGLATFMSWRKQYGDTPFPTADGQLHFCRISSSLNEQMATRALAHTLHLSGITEKLRVAEAGRDHVRALLLDDWMIRGRTLDITKQSLGKLGLIEGRNLSLKFGTMVGENRPELAVFGTSNRRNNAIWSDSGNSIGVDYYMISPYVPSPTEDIIRPQVIRHPEALQLRQEVRDAFRTAYTPDRARTVRGFWQRLGKRVTRS